MENEVNERINELRARIANNEAEIAELQNANRQAGAEAQATINNNNNNAQIRNLESDINEWRRELTDIQNGTFVKEVEEEVEHLEMIDEFPEDTVQWDVQRLAVRMGKKPEDFKIREITSGDDTEKFGYGDDKPLNIKGVFLKTKTLEKVKKTYKRVDREVEEEVEHLEKIDEFPEDTIQWDVQRLAARMGRKPEDFEIREITSGDDTEKFGYGDDKTLNIKGVFLKTKKLEKVIKSEWVDEREINKQKEKDEKESEKDKIEEPEEPFIPLRNKDKENDNDIDKMKEEYDRLNDMYLDVLEELEEKRNKLNNGEIPYEEYQKYALYAIDRYNDMKDMYDKIESNITLTKEDKKVQEPWLQGDEKDKPEDKKEDLPNKDIPQTPDKETDSLTILYHAREGVYAYTGISNGKQIDGMFKAERNIFKKSKNKATLLQMYGEQGFEELFSGATAKAYKKCDVNVVKILRENFGVNAARDYLVELMNGKKGRKDNMLAKITYDLSELKVASKIQTKGGKDAKVSLFDRFRIKRNAKLNKYIASVIPVKKMSSLFKQYEQKALNEGTDKKQPEDTIKTNYEVNPENTKNEFMDGIKVNVPTQPENNIPEQDNQGKQPNQPTRIDVEQGKNPLER